VERASGGPDTKVTKVVKAATREQAAGGLQYGLYAVKGSVQVLSEGALDDFQDDGFENALDFIIDSPSLEEALKKVDSTEASLSPQNKKRAVQFLKRYYRPKASLYTFKSGNSGESPLCLVVVGQVKKLVGGVYGIDSFLRLLPKFGSLFSGCKAVDVGRYGDGGVWQRSKDEFIVYVGDND
jgi:hypothetical protein